LDKIYPKRYPNFTVVNGGEKVSNAHYRRCERLELPTVTVRCERNYAWLDIDFMDINYRMDKILRLMIDTIGADYRKLRQRYVRGKRHSLGYISLHHNSSREMATFKIFINDAYPIADVLMPLINDRSYWVQR
jgi:hypothetical protein